MKNKKNSRLIAIETLHQLELSAKPLPILFQQVCAEQDLDGVDRSLAMNFIYGVLRQKQYLDSIISKLYGKPLKKLHPLVHQALAVGLYQLFFLTRIPESAAVNETVKAIKKANAPKRLHGFVNGVLRQSIRQRHNLPAPDTIDGSGQHVLNHPEWLTTRWQHRFGEKEMVAICRENNFQRPLTLRVNTVLLKKELFLDRLADNNILAEPGRYAPDAVVLKDYHGPVPTIPGYDQGHFQVQDEAAQLASLILNPFHEEGHYLDGCSGLGGKTGHLLQLLHDCRATLTAVEPEPHRQEKLVSNLDRLFAKKQYHLFRGSLQQFYQETEERFNGVLIDAPCSGTGVTGRHPDIRWRRNQNDIKKYAITQLELANLAASLVVPGGVLVYATCSLEVEENEEVVTQFLRTNTNFSLDDCSLFLPPAASRLVKNGFFQPRPTDGVDGFFAARLVRNSGDD